MDDQDMINPNHMPFDETVRLFRNGTIGVKVDQGLAIAAVRSGLPLSKAGQMANMMVMLSPIIGLVLAILFSWWWVIVGLAAAVGNFRIARSECVRSVRNRFLDDERLFTFLRDRGAIRFEFMDD